MGKLSCLFPRCLSVNCPANMAHMVWRVSFHVSRLSHQAVRPCFPALSRKCIGVWERGRSLSQLILNTIAKQMCAQVRMLTVSEQIYNGKKIRENYSLKVITTVPHRGFFKNFLIRILRAACCNYQLYSCKIEKFDFLKLCHNKGLC